MYEEKGPNNVWRTAYRENSADCPWDSVVWYWLCKWLEESENLFLIAAHISRTLVLAKLQQEDFTKSGRGGGGTRFGKMATSDDSLDRSMCRIRNISPDIYTFA